MNKSELLGMIAVFCLAILLLMGFDWISHSGLVGRISKVLRLQSGQPSLEGKGILENIERQSKILKEANEFGISYVTNLADGEKFIQRIRQNADLHEALESAKKKVKVLYIYEGKLCLPWKGAIESIVLTENDKEIIGFLLNR